MVGYVFESIAGHLSSDAGAVLAHRIDPKRQAIDTLTCTVAACCLTRAAATVATQNAEIAAFIGVRESVTSQSGHGLHLQGSPPSGNVVDSNQSRCPSG